MKKIFTSIAVAALALPAFAGFDYTATPEPGVVTALDGVILTFDDYEEIDINTHDDLSVEYNGTPLSGVTFQTEDNSLVIGLRPAAVEPGTYTVTIGAYALCGYADGYAVMDDNEQAIVVTYEIAGGGVVSGDAFEYTVDPAEGNVKEISVVNVSFPALEYIDVNSSDDIMAIFKGEAVGCKVKNDPYGSNNVRITLDSPINTAGHLEIYFGEYSIGGETAEGSYSDLDHEISINYTIGGAVQVGPDFSFTLSPEAGNVESLSEVTFTFDKISFMMGTSQNIYSVTRDGEALASSAYSAKLDGNKVTFTFSPALEGEGTVVCAIAANGIMGQGADGQYAMNPNALTAEYTLVAAAEPVVYDLIISAGKPQFKTETNEGIVTPDNDLEIINISTPVYGIGIAEGAVAVLSNADDSFYTEAPLKIAMSANGWPGVFTQFKISFPELPEYDGVYYLTIAKGSFGTEEWMENHETGRSNDEICLEYVFEGFGVPEDPITYTLAPAEVTPAPETTVSSLETIVLTFDERVYDTMDGEVVLSNTENRYSANASVSVKGKVVTLTFANAPTEYGNYSLSISKGRFCDSTYAETMEEGNLNDELFYTWTFDPTQSGVETIGAAASEAPVYNMMGVKVADSVENLPAGLYISNGRKVVVK